MKGAPGPGPGRRGGLWPVYHNYPEHAGRFLIVGIDPQVEASREGGGDCTTAPNKLSMLNMVDTHPVEVVYHPALLIQRARGKIPIHNFAPIRRRAESRAPLRLVGPGGRRSALSLGNSGCGSRHHPPSSVPTPLPPPKT
jgi:hypothetical protein